MIDGLVKIVPFTKNNPMNKYIGMFGIASYSNHQEFHFCNTFNVLFNRVFHSSSARYKGFSLYVSKLLSVNKISDVPVEVDTLAARLNAKPTHYIKSNDLVIVYFRPGNHSPDEFNGKSYFPVYYFKNNSGYRYDLSARPAIHDLITSPSILSILE